MAREWVRPLIATGNDALRYLGKFYEAMDAMFTNESQVDMTQQQLLALRQGKLTVRSYWSQFAMLVLKLGWDLSS